MRPAIDGEPGRNHIGPMFRLASQGAGRRLACDRWDEEPTLDLTHPRLWATAPKGSTACGEAIVAAFMWTGRTGVVGGCKRQFISGVRGRRVIGRVRYASTWARISITSGDSVAVQAFTQTASVEVSSSKPSRANTSLCRFSGRSGRIWRLGPWPATRTWHGHARWGGTAREPG